jgi:disulfide bond formation protein DsbB
MPQWMIVIFAIYSVILVAVLLSKITNKKAH